MKKLNNYFFSSWIANFGVVPLLLLLAFLLCPILTFLFSLLSLVTAVLETIIYPLSADTSSKQLNYKDSFLRQDVQYVKKVVSLAACVITLIPSNSRAQTPAIKDNILISKGQHKEINIKLLSHFSVGNPEIISTKYLKSKKVLLIKGKKLGFSELIIWFNNKEKMSFNIYVLSKRRHLKIFHLIETLKHLGLTPNLKGPIILCDGEIDSLKKLNILQNLIKENPQSVYFRGNLKRSLRNYIFGKIFKLFFEEHIDHIRCEAESINIECFYPDSYHPSSAVLNYLKNNFQAKFIPIKNFDSSKNFKFKIKIIQMEKSNGESINLGLSNLSGNLSLIFTEGIKGLVKNNEYLLGEKRIHLSILGESEGVIKLNDPSSFELFSNFHNQNQTTPFGIKVSLKLNKKDQTYNISYKTNLVTGINDESVQNKQSSSLSIDLGKTIQIFEIGLTQDQKTNDHIPYLGKIPLIGLLFRSYSIKKNFKKLIGIIHLDENSND